MFTQGGILSHPTLLFCEDPVHAVANAADFHDLQITEVRFGGDPLLECGSQGTCKGNSQCGKRQCNR